MTIFSPDPKPIQRFHVEDLSKAPDPIPRAEVAQIKSLLNGRKGLALIRQKMIERYATIIGEVESTQTGTKAVELQKITNVAIADSFSAGMWEVTRAFKFEEIVGYQARLFGSSRYEYSDETTADNLTPVRERGQYDIATQVGDFAACAAGSSLVYLSTEGDSITYDDVWIDELYYAFAPDVLEEGGKKRPTNTLRLDEASVVVLRLAKTGRKARYAAWFGASDKYETGRHVVYETDGHWHQIPEPGDQAAMDWSPSVQGYETATTDIANPLTWWGRGKKLTPTYPFAILKGDPKGRGTLLPSTGVGLHQVMLEYDVASSVILRAANDGAIGKRILTTDEDQPLTIPSSLHDLTVILGRGQDLQNIGWSPENAAKAQEVMIQQLRSVAEAHHVPGYLMVTDWSTYPSGTALRQARADMDEYRDVRIGLNRPGVARLWEIERALIGMSGDAIGEDVTQTWIPGRPHWPENPKEQAEAAQLRKTLGVDDIIETTLELKGLNTRDEVFKYRETLKEDQDQVAETEFAKAAAPAAPAAPAGRFFQRNVQNTASPNTTPDGGETPNA